MVAAREVAALDREDGLATEAASSPCSFDSGTSRRLDTNTSDKAPPAVPCTMRCRSQKESRRCSRCGMALEVLAVLAVVPMAASAIC